MPEGLFSRSCSGCRLFCDWLMRIERKCLLACGLSSGLLRAYVEGGIFSDYDSGYVPISSSYTMFLPNLPLHANSVTQTVCLLYVKIS